MVRKMKKRTIKARESKDNGTISEETYHQSKKLKNGKIPEETSIKARKS
ncbi:hypothetical protein [Bacillus sp. P14.5]|nr:hypothetical protein [Bacillus sp. P14.5]